MKQSFTNLRSHTLAIWLTREGGLGRQDFHINELSHLVSRTEVEQTPPDTFPHIIGLVPDLTLVVVFFAREESGAGSAAVRASRRASSSPAPGGRKHLETSNSASAFLLKTLSAKGTKAEPDFEDVASGLQLAVQKDMHGILPIVGLPSVEADSTCRSF